MCRTYITFISEVSIIWFLNAYFTDFVIPDFQIILNIAASPEDEITLILKVAYYILCPVIMERAHNSITNIWHITPLKGNYTTLLIMWDKLGL